MTSTYDEVLNCPDTHCRKEALDKLCEEKIVEGMEKATVITAQFPSFLGEAVSCFRESLMARIRQAAKDLEDS